MLNWREICSLMVSPLRCWTGWRFQRSPTGVCSVCSLLQSGGLGLECGHVRTNAYLDDRLVSADSCDPLPRTLEITKQDDDHVGAVLNSKKSSWTSTKLPSRRRRKLCVNSLVTPGHLCILVLMCLCGVPRGVSLVCE